MDLHIHSMISVLQALQLVALAPCVFVIVFLLTTQRERMRILVPCLYFMALAASFLLPLMELWPQLSRHPVYSGVIFAPTLLPALSFLLIIQFATDRVPPPAYWGVLALPLIGGSGLVYASLLADELCLPSGKCFSATDVEGLYATLGNGLIFLLLMAVFMRTGNARPRNKTARNEYWLIVALIGLNLCSMAVALWQLQGTLAELEAVFIDTVLRMTFIYVVLTLLFRVFDHTKASEQPETRAIRQSPAQLQRDKAVIEAFEKLMREQQLYREMDCSRESIAQKLDISENMLSRIINQHYQARFTDVINQYRVKDAQRLLLADSEQAVTDIAFGVGFNSIPSFNRVFKDNTGFSPTAFRATRVGKRRR